MDHTDGVEAERFDSGLVVGYRLVGIVGEGPTGVVYRCVSTGASASGVAARPLVMKVLHRELCHAASMVALRSDLDRLALCADPHVAQLVDSGFTDDGRFFLVTEELAGLDLGVALEGAGPVPVERALEVMRQVCAAVRSAHSAGVVHGGLKPRNVLLISGGTVRVTDFAASRRADAAGGVLFGDPRYMSPEQLGGFSDARSDVYALGVLLHQLLTGELPSASAGGAEVALAHLRAGAGERNPSSGTAHDARIDRIDGGLRRIWERALDPRPSVRFANAGQLLVAIEAWSRNDELARAAAQLAAVRAPVRHEAMLDAGRNVDPVARRGRAPLADAPALVMSAAAPPTSGHDAANGHADSMESSLEDFISQAAKSFGEPSEGWSLNTDEVELVDAEEARGNAARSAPVPPAAPPATPIAARAPTIPPVLPTPPAPAAPVAAVAPAAPVVVPAAPVVAAPAVVEAAAAAPAFSSDPSVPVTEGASGSTAVTAMPVFEEPAVAAPAAAAVVAAPVVAAPAPMSSAAAPARPAPAVAAAPIALATQPAPVAAAPAARPSSPIPLAVGAAVGGAVLVLAIMRIMGPPVAAPIAAPVPPAPIVAPAVTVTPTPKLTPIVTPTVTPAVAAPTVTPTPAAAPSNTPVVTPLPTPAPAPAAGVPVVTPIPAAAPVAAPVVAPTVAPSHAAAPAAHPRHHAAAAPKPAAKPAPKPVAAKPAAKPVVAPASKPATKPAAPASAPKKGDKKGDGWVDPFAG